MSQFRAKLIPARRNRGPSGSLAIFVLYAIMMKWRSLVPQANLCEGSREKTEWHFGKRFPSRARRLISISAVLTLLGVALGAVSHATDFYVATNGTPAGDGSIGNPWNLVTALTNPPSVHPGDTIWLRGGVYTTTPVYDSGSGWWKAFQSTLAGASNNLVTLRQYPGERATLDGGSNQTLEVESVAAYSAYRDFEITQSNPNRTNAPYASGIFDFGHDTKFINLIIHDNGGNGIVAGANATNAEVSGCIIYNNGYQGAYPDRGHGHGLYLQGNNPLLKFIRGNVSFNNYAIAMKAYAEGPNIDGFYFLGNTCFGSGSISQSNGLTYNLQIGGLSMTHRIIAVSNYTWHAGLPNINMADFEFFYGTETNGDLVVSNNYFAGGEGAVKYWSNGIVLANTWIMGGNYLVNDGIDGSPADRYVMDYNTYYFPMGRAAPFYYGFPQPGYTNYNFTGWKTYTGYDIHSTSTNAMPAGTNVFIVRDAYDVNRTTVTVYNWNLSTTVDVDVSNLLQVGAPYEVRNVQDWYGAPVLTNKYDGTPLHLPMTGLSLAQPIGLAPPPPTGPQFNVFVVRQFPASQTLAPADNLHLVNTNGP